MGNEIERKYKIDEIPKDIIFFDKKIIRQGYVVIARDKSELRIRQIGKNYYLTYKSGTGLKREELEVLISAAFFRSLWPSTIGKRIEKERAKVKWGKLTIEIDFFKNQNSKLIIAEVEFSSIAESKKFNPPEWFGKEVTNDYRYRNQKLAK